MDAGNPAGRHGVRVDPAVETADPSAAERSGVPTRVLLIDDHEMFTSSLGVVLDAEPDMTVVATAPSAAEGMRKAADSGAEVVLLDHRLPYGDGVTLIPRLLALDPAPKVVMLTASTLDSVLVAAIEAGAAGFIDKSRAVTEVIAAIRSAAAGESLISPAMLARLLPRLRRQESDPAWTITERERDLLRLFSQRIGVAVPRHELSSDDSTGSERAIDVQINRLRRKIEADPSNPVYLQTVRGKGYILYTD